MEVLHTHMRESCRKNERGRERKSEIEVEKHMFVRYRY